MRLCLALSAALLFVQTAVAAEEKRPLASDTLKPPTKHASSSPITDRFALRLLYAPLSLATDFRLDSEFGTLGTPMIVEDTLGLADSKNQGRAEMMIRLRERNRLRIDYMKISRFGDKRLDQEIEFGNQTFFLNDRAQTHMEWRDLTLTYMRSLLYTPRFEFAIGAGVSLLEARASGEVVARGIREAQESVGAFPTFGFDGTWRISKRWSFNGRAQRFTARVDEFQGSLANYHADVQYRWRENFSLGLGYSKYHTLVDIGNGDPLSTDELTGRFDQIVKGPEMFIRASF